MRAALFSLSTKICSLHGFIVQQFGAGTGESDPTGFHNVAKIRGLQCHVGVLLDQQNSNALLVDLLNDVKDAS